jgi:class 3 adenylate cyclase
MDLHDVTGGTREMLETAHEHDLALQEQYGVKLYTYWFDDVRGTAFCLFDADREGAIQDLHKAAHGNVPHQIIPVDIMAVKSFLGRITDPLPETTTVPSADHAHVDAAFRTVMFTDLKDSTAMTAQLGEDKALHLLRVHNRLIRQALREHGGSEVKHTGDGIMASFARSSDAIKCAIAIQGAFASHNAETPQHPMYVRIGMDAGEPVEESGDLFGSTVQLASRLCALAEPEQILTSKTVCQECASARASFAYLGERVLKGFASPAPVYAVSWQ